MGINNPNSAGGAWTLLHDETLAVDGKFDVQNIPATHDHLFIYLLSRGTVVATTDNLNIILNNDTTAANYRRAYHQVNNAVHAVGQDDAILGAGVPAGSSPANYFGMCEIRLWYYTVAQNKMYDAISNGRMSTTISLTSIQVGQWENTAAVDRVTIQTDNDPTDLLLAGSRLQIWGIN
jgi:hypothetical protein